MSQNHTMDKSEERNEKPEEKVDTDEMVTEDTQADVEASVEEDVESNESSAEQESAQEQDDEKQSSESVSLQVEQLQKQVDELQNRLLRTQADYDNFRRRTRLEKEDFAKYASQKLLEQLIPVVDNFERAVLASEENQDLDSLIKGLNMIYRQFSQVLEQEGVKPIEAVGQPFNPEFHQAVMQVESDEHEEGIVVEELQKGYMLKDKVIRPSMVKVSS